MKVRKLSLCVLVLLLVGSLVSAGGRQEAPAPDTPAAVVDDAWQGTGVVHVYADIAAYTAATGENITSFSEAPMLRRMVEQGNLPAVEERLPVDPLVVVPADRIGRYGNRFRETHLGDDANITDLFYELPLLYDARLEDLTPNIIKAWDFSSDGRTVTFYLREGMRWSDGEPFTADDFVFWSDHVAWDTDINPAGLRDMRIAGEMGRFEKVDDYTFRAVFPHPNASFVERMAFGFRPYLPKHYMARFHPAFTSRAEVDRIVNQEGYASWVDLFESKSVKTENPDLPVINAWKLTSGTLDDPVQRYERNPYYWKVDIAGNQLPYVDGIDRFNVGDSLEAMLLRAMAGETDYADGAETLGSVANFSVLRQNEQSGNYRILQMAERSPLARPAILFNMNHPDPEFREILRNRDFRKALSFAIDNPRINNLFYEGTYHLRQGFAPPGGAPYHGERDIFSVGMTFEPDRANRMLDDMGLRWNAARTRRITDSGKELNFTYIVRTRTPDFVPMSELIEENWAQIGIGITIRPVSGGLWNETVETNRHDVAMDQWGFGGRAPDIPVFRDLAPRDDGWKADPGWGLWLVTRGDLGIEPPPDMIGHMRRLAELQSQALAATSVRQRQSIEKQMFEWHAEQFLWIAPINQPGDHAQTHWYYFHNRVKNVTVPPPRENYYGLPASWFIEE